MIVSMQRMTKTRVKANDKDAGLLSCARQLGSMCLQCTVPSYGLLPHEHVKYLPFTKFVVTKYVERHSWWNWKQNYIEIFATSVMNARHVSSVAYTAHAHTREQLQFGRRAMQPD